MDAARPDTATEARGDSGRGRGLDLGVRPKTRGPGTSRDTTWVSRLQVRSSLVCLTPVLSETTVRVCSESLVPTKVSPDSALPDSSRVAFSTPGTAFRCLSFCGSLLVLLSSRRALLPWY